MKFLLGTKQHMTQVFDERGRARPATIIKAIPVTVANIKTKKEHGYDAVLVSAGKRAHKEFRVSQEDTTQHKVKDEITVSIFEPGDTVTVSGISKGKGFQGVVKRHGFKGGPRTHGQKHSEREAGSIGATGPQRVFKGKRMPGRMGGGRVTVKNLTVLQVDEKTNTLVISGAVPGRRGTRLEVRET